MKNTKSFSQGFTLVELMTVVAILGILITVAMPWYGDYVMRGNRADAIAPMQDIMNAQERFYNDNVTYTTDLTNLGFAATTFATSKGFYSIQARACTDSAGNAVAITQCVELLATAQGDQATDGNLVMDTRGKQQRVIGSDILSWDGN